MLVDLGESERWALVIDTDTYAGNFERELAAYCTGETAECGHGEGEAELYFEEMGIAPAEEGGPFFEQIEHRPDDHGVMRPVSIFSNPNWVNDGMGTHYRVDDWEPQKVLKKYQQSHIDWAEQHRHSYADEEYGNKEADREIAKAKALTVNDLHQHPAYNSVAIFFYKKPTDEQIRIIKERAQKFFSSRWGYTRLTQHTKSPVPQIEGFRLVCEQTTLKEKPV